MSDPIVTETAPTAPVVTAPASTTPNVAPPVTAVSPAVNTPTSSAKYIVGEDGSFSPDFKTMIPEDLRGHSVLDKYKNLPDLIKGTINAQSALGKKASDYFTSEDPVVVAERNKIMGIPEKAEDYKISRELATGEKLGEEGEKMFREWAVANKLPAHLAQPAIEFHASIVKRINEQVTAAAEEQRVSAEKAMREEWKGDRFEHNTKQARNVLMNEFGLTAEDLTMPIGNSTKLVKALIEKYVPLVGEDKIIEGSMAVSGGSAEEQIKQINIDMHKTQTGTPEYAKLIEAKKTLMSRMK